MILELWQSVTRWLGGGLQRRRGLQNAGPLEYDGQAAATVTFDTAMQLSAVWACVKLLAETVASLPLAMYALGTVRQIERDHPLALLLAGKPNPYQTKIEFFETILVNLLLYGNAYVHVVRMETGRVTMLMPLMSAQMEVTVLAGGGIAYTYYHDAGVQVYAPASIWHLKMLGNGVIGLSPLAYMRNTAGIAIGAEKAATKIYANGAKPSGVLTMDKYLTPEQRAQVRTNFNTLTTGTDERLLVLEGGVKFEAVSMSPEDIELLASRKYQVQDIARWFGVPSVLINDNNTTTWGSGIEQIVQGFYKLTLRPILEKIEASMRAHLLQPAERTRYEFEFDFEGLLRADQKSRFDGYRVGVQGGIVTPNEARAWEGLPPMSGGDVLYMQGATVPIEQTGRQTQVMP
jgi:HK97 family phage portal protein